MKPSGLKSSLRDEAGPQAVELLDLGCARPCRGTAGDCAFIPSARRLCARPAPSPR